MPLTTVHVATDITPHHVHGFQRHTLSATDLAPTLPELHQMSIMESFMVEDNTLTLEGEMYILGL